MAYLSRRDRSTRCEWQDVSLSSVRTVATIAAGAGRAVLWGNDVVPDLWRDIHGIRA